MFLTSAQVLRVRETQNLWQEEDQVMQVHFNVQERPPCQEIEDQTLFYELVNRCLGDILDEFAIMALLIAFRMACLSFFLVVVIYTM